MRVWKVRAPRGARTFHTLTSARRRRAEVSHSLTLYRYIQTSNANPRANMHTSMDHGRALRGKFCMFVSHICDIVIDMLYADHQATVSCEYILPIVKKLFNWRFQTPYRPLCDVKCSPRSLRPPRHLVPSSRIDKNSSQLDTDSFLDANE